MLSSPLSLLLWPAYWAIQGTVMTGIWVIAHECGHQSFSKYVWVNNTVGLIFHSLLLVPYHSWRISHGMHHKATGHLDKDQVYVPKTKSAVMNSDDIHTTISESPLVNLLQIFMMLLVGFPAYLATNAFGQDYGKRTNHFEVASPIFKPEQRKLIVLSDITLAIMLAALAFVSYQYSFMFVMKYYGMPYLVVNLFLVLITFLHHTDSRVPHYRGEQWSFIRGALCTVDRDYGILSFFWHNIGDTHVAHHLFSMMPHYHAQEATMHLKKFLGRYYLEDNTPILTALWRNWNSCRFVEDEGDVLFYQSNLPKHTPTAPASSASKKAQ